MRKASENMGTERVHLEDKSVFDISMKTAASLNTPGFEGKTLLAITAVFGQHQIVKKLLEKGADPTIKDNSSMTAIDHTIAGRKTGLKQWRLSYLQSEGFNLSMADISDNIALTERNPSLARSWELRREGFVKSVELLAARNRDP